MINKKILIVDDEESICLLLNSALKSKGYDVLTVNSSSEALNLLEKETILVMFLDLNLPDMNGVELCQQIMKKNPLTIAYAITGYASHFELAECKEAGFEDYFKKPVSLVNIYKAAERAFEKLERWKKN